jgi:hypothetical protein
LSQGFRGERNPVRPRLARLPRHARLARVCGLPGGFIVAIVSELVRGCVDPMTAVEHDLRCRVLIVRTPGSADLREANVLGCGPRKRLSHRPAPRPRHRVTGQGVRGSRATSPKPLHNGPWCTSAAERFPPADPHPRGRSIPDGDACLGPQCWGLSAFVGIDQRGSGRPSQTAAS